MKVPLELDKALSESQQLSRCLNLLCASKVSAWRNNVGVAKYDDKRTVRFGIAGTSDILGFVREGPLKGMFFAFEVKRFSKKPTQKQQNFLDNLTDADAICGWGTANDLADLLLLHKLD